MLTHPKNWIIDKFFVSLHNTKNQSNWTEHQFYMAKNVLNMTWHLFVNIFHFYILLNSQPALSTKIPDFFFNKVEEYVRKACVCSYSFTEQPLELTSQCLFQRSSNKTKFNQTSPQQKGTSIQLQSYAKSKIKKVTRRIPLIQESNS